MKKTKIGGQAVLEGVMMRGATSEALAVRDENGHIRLDTKRLKAKKPWYKKVPFLRGIVNLVISMVDGMKIISKSAEVMVEDEIDSSDGKGMGVMMGISVLVGLLLAAALFIFLPSQLTAWIMKWCGIENVKWARSLLEGGFKLLILILYMVSVTAMKEIKRVFMYHGAEHKTIACYEHELPLTVENVKKCSRYHDRCGTSFIVFVVVMSVLLMFAAEAICYAVGFEQIGETWVRTLIKIAMLPITAGISYELLMLLASTNFILFRPLKWFGKQFQRLTTREPDESMCEVAIAAFTKVLEMDADQSIEEVHFPAPVPLSEFKHKVLPLCDFGTMEKCDLDWILCSVLKVPRSKLHEDLSVPFGWQIKVEKMIERCNNGEPLQYVLGNTEFYGRQFDVNADVLIPRPETELVCEQAVKAATSQSRVLDLCCGSGAIGITVALEKRCDVTLCDISDKALAVAEKNAKKHKAKAKFVKSDMFQSIKGKFDVIVSNPPYVETAVIDNLDAKVRDYEPKLALDGGEDGLNFYRVIANKAHGFLKSGGALILEIGYNQAQAVTELLEGRYDVEVKKDYGGNDRIICAKLK
ncbi:MAG: peptide chain release factor N(5)-glutamine methyltransferase [Corallococcus sp.]|nr:peptide chain release factor N(5)-glutamine methyltransferase [Corallococcus sp.]